MRYPLTSPYRGGLVAADIFILGLTEPWLITVFHGSVTVTVFKIEKLLFTVQLRFLSQLTVINRTEPLIAVRLTVFPKHSVNRTVSLIRKKRKGLNGIFFL